MEGTCGHRCLLYVAGCWEASLLRGIYGEGPCGGVGSVLGSDCSAVQGEREVRHCLYNSTKPLMHDAHEEIE